MAYHRPVAYRAAPPDSSVVLACSLLVARRALVAALVSALTAAGYYAAAGPEGAMVWGPLLLLAVFLLRASVQRSARVTLRVDARRRRLWMRSAPFLRGGREREVELTDAEAIGVETQRSAHWLRHLPWGPLLEGHISIRDSAGEIHPLFEPRFNVRAQAKVAARLAALFDVDRRPVVGVDVPLPPASNATSGRVLIIAVLGGVLGLTVVVGLVAQRAMTAERGWLDVRCTSTCRLQGMTCLEGGQLSGAFDAGEVVVEVADPAAPGGFRPVAVPIRVGHRTSFECLPDARAPNSVPE